MGADDKPPAVFLAAAAASTRIRLKREDCKRTKHDSVFSHWKILIGPSDWEDHSQGKESAERYRIQNLPNCSSCTGVYELGIVGSQYRRGRESAKLDPNSVIPVYLGRSDNVRNRLQQYGRGGAHLGNCSLFSEMFSEGFSVVYRWAPMKSSRDSEKTEADLLDTFDYAWNKDSNGPRRPEDILKKIYSSSKASQFLEKYYLFPKKAKGIRIKIFEPPLLHKGDSFYAELPSNNIFHQILKFGRSRPKLLPWRSSISEDSRVCGVALGHGVICQRIPPEGRKRCEEHKGMKINASNRKILADGKSAVDVNKDLIQQPSPVCGVVIDDGSSCAREPIRGNKRCIEHKGQRTHALVSKLVKGDEEHYVQGPIPHKNLLQNTAPHFPDELAAPPNEHRVSTEPSIICGVGLGEGFICTREPLKGRKRCEEHRGMKIKMSNSKSLTEQTPSTLDKNISPTCGEALQNGSFCRRKSSEGNNRCWQHKGTKPTTSQSSSFSHSDYNVTSSLYREGPSSTCGAPLRNGTYCRRRTKDGRCWQH